MATASDWEVCTLSVYGSNTRWFLTQPHLAATPTVAGPDGERGRGRGGGTQGWRARAGSDGCGDSMGIPELILVSYLV